MMIEILLLSALNLATAAQPGNTLQVQITGISKQTGFIMAELKDAKGNVIKQLKHDVKALGTTLTFQDLKAGSYAIAVFHDADADGKLDTNLVGMPTEKYGFSNHARGTFGPPSLDDQLFSFDKSANLEIKVK